MADARAKRNAAWIAGLIPAIVFAIIAAALIGADALREDASADASSPLGARAADDQNRYHLVAIETFALEWPRVALSDYPSATTPGYHLLLAAAKRYLGLDEVGLRAAGALLTIGLLATLGAWLGRRAGALAGAALALPIALSLYVVSSGAWLLPDNLAWWGALAIALLALAPRQRPALWVWAGVILVGVVGVRQAHVWTAAAIWAGAWLSGLQEQRALPLPTTPPEARAVAQRTALALLCALPAALLLVVFVRVWGGLTPPTFQADLSRVNLATPGLALALLGVYSVFLSGFAVPAAARVWREERRRALVVVLAGAAAGFAIGSAPESFYSQTDGRWSGLWNLVREAPVVMERSLLFVGLSTLGGMAAAAWWALLPWRERWILAAALVAFIAAMSVNHNAWQRYLEPMLLMLVAIAAAALWREGGAPAGRRRTAAAVGALALAMAQGAITLRGVL